MSADAEPLEETAEELYEDAPCGYLSTRVDGTIVRVNRTFEAWTRRSREQLVGRMRFQDLLPPGGQIYYETHYAPLLAMQGTVRAIALEIVRGDGTRLPALVNSVTATDRSGRPRAIRTMVFDATDRRRYEQELLRAARREHEIAHELQQSLLAGALPGGPGLELHTFYSPAVRGTEVGGDWYDAFWVVDDEVVGLVVGDVVGRGISAAATMGQLRSAVRALASTGLGPAALLLALDAYSRRHDVGQMTTVVYAQVALADLELRFACAGHPPPLILEPGREPYFAWEGRSPPINPYEVVDERPEARSRLSAGSTVLLYTDGLIEQPRDPQRDGMKLLRLDLAARRDEDQAELLRTLARELRAPGAADDVCLLAARFPRG